MQFEQILDGFVFLEGPRVGDDGSFYFSDVMLGGVHRLSPSGKVESFVTDRAGTSLTVTDCVAVLSPGLNSTWNGPAAVAPRLAMIAV